MSCILLVPFHVYLLFQAIDYFSLNDVERHWCLTVHLSAVLFVGFFTQFVTALLPADPSVQVGSAGNLLLVVTDGRSGAIEALRVLQPALLFISGILVGTTPRGPKLYFPLEKIYTPKTIASLKELAASDEATPSSKTALDPSVPNVTGEASGSVIDYLFFNYCQAVINTAQTSISLDVWDLPVVRASMRALGLYKTMRKAYGETQKKRVTARDARKAGRALPPGWNLLWKVYKVNGTQFAIRKSLHWSVVGCRTERLLATCTYRQRHPSQPSLPSGTTRLLTFSRSSLSTLSSIPTGRTSVGDGSGVSRCSRATPSSLLPSA
jgi:hypothetical protein